MPADEREQPPQWTLARQALAMYVGNAQLFCRRAGAACLDRRESAPICCVMAPFYEPRSDSASAFPSAGKPETARDILNRWDGRFGALRLAKGAKVSKDLSGPRTPNRAIQSGLTELGTPKLDGERLDIRRIDVPFASPNFNVTDNAIDSID